jgi:hypothetical protein
VPTGQTGLLRTELSSARRRTKANGLAFASRGLCQNELITKPQLVAAFSVWLAERSKGLDQILVDQAALTQTQRAVIDSLVNLQLAKHGGIEKSLQQLMSSMDAVV